MKRKIIFSVFAFLLVAFTFSSLLYAEPDSPIRLKDNLFSIDFVNETHGWAVGYWGTVLATRDGGGDLGLSGDRERKSAGQCRLC